MIGAIHLNAKCSCMSAVIVDERSYELWGIPSNKTIMYFGVKFICSYCLVYVYSSHLYLEIEASVHASGVLSAPDVLVAIKCFEVFCYYIVRMISYIELVVVQFL